MHAAILVHMIISILVFPIPNAAGSLVTIDSNDDVARAYKQQVDHESRELFASFRVFCNRKSVSCNATPFSMLSFNNRFKERNTANISLFSFLSPTKYYLQQVQCKEVLLEDTDIAKALIECVSAHSVELLVLGAPSRSGIVRRFRTTDVPSLVSKGAPPFCTVYVISKGRISSVRAASAPIPAKPTPRNALQQQSTQRLETQLATPRSAERLAYGACPLPGDDDIKSPFTRGGRSSYKPYESSIPDSDISFVSSGRPSIERMLPSMFDDLEPGMAPRLSNSSDFDGRSSESSFSGARSIDMNYSQGDFSFSSQDSGGSSSRLSLSDDMEAEMRRLKLELKQTMEMYSTACKEALTARQKAMELQRWKLEEQKKLEEARMSEEAALALAEREKAKCRAAIEAAEASKKIAELEAQKRLNAEMKALKESEQKKKTPDTFSQGSARYRRYTIEEIEEATECFADSLKIGEGGYGPVYRCELDLTPVAVKVLRPDAAQGRSQFQQEVEVLSCIRHPNMVLLLGACPEYGCLVYEYMANGSLEDCLFRKRHLPPLPWQLRFRIAVEIATGLLFLHQTRPEPLVHRDLKPANILLDRNFVSKISDVGLARLVPPSVADSVTQYRMTSTAGTFCYIDPEYQQTGMLGIKSDIYSLGIMLLQMITAKPPMGLTHHVGRAIENGTFTEILDPALEDWPVEEALQFAKLALQCAEMRRKDRPDLKKVVLPQLNILRDFAEDNMPMMVMFGRSTGFASNNRNSSTTSKVQDVLNDSQSISGISVYESRSSTSPLGRI
ncbi:U-box domain-containing protein 35-like isoform X2 [Prosopis cineraria]|uniref:U-box domain-containing protein 35-like isoform X2 n=1 Tax=Prosopis cineraria TaxID=364024 RepID=UPI002410125A|nr:U-box domain-containing protein 35-like isoform X2 [Prosopis cineraria]